jgi:phosphoglycolate phosphatase
MTTILGGDQVFPSIEAILFDKDGTLAQVEAYLKQLGQRRSRIIDAQVPGVQDPLLMAFGLDEGGLNPAGLLAVGTRLETEIAAAAYVAETGRDWWEALEIVHGAFQEADLTLKPKAPATPLFEGLLPMLQSLSETVKLGILSSDSTAHVQEFVDTYHLQNYFQFGQGTDTLEIRKPNPQLLWQACQQLQVPPDAMLYVGDAEVDGKMAIAAGIAGCIGVTWGWSRPVTLHSPSVILHHWDQLRAEPN